MHVLIICLSFFIILWTFAFWFSLLFSLYFSKKSINNNKSLNRPNKSLKTAIKYTIKNWISLGRSWVKKQLKIFLVILIYINSYLIHWGNSCLYSFFFNIYVNKTRPGKFRKLPQEKKRTLIKSLITAVVTIVLSSHVDVAISTWPEASDPWPRVKLRPICQSNLLPVQIQNP